MTFFVYSTSTNAHVINGVVIQGGHGLPNKHLWTPQGVATQITEEQHNAIKDHRVFKQLVDGGHLRVEKKKVEAKKVAKDMEQKDASAQATEKDFKKKSADKNQKAKTN